MSAKSKSGQREIKRILPDPVVGALAGCGLGILAWTGHDIWLRELLGFVLIAFVVVGAIGGCVIGLLRQGPPGRGRTVAWWCVTMTWIVGGVSFLMGFVGPTIFEPDNHLGPMSGIFVAGPLGAIAGAVYGIVIGLVVRRV